MATTTYNDISNRQLQKAILPFLKAAMPKLVTERFGQAFVQGEGQSRVATFRRINKLDNTPVALVDGVSPTGIRPTATDIQTTLTQYGRFIEYTDQLVDFGEKGTLEEFAKRLGQNAAEVAENIRLDILKAGTNAFFNSSTTAVLASVDSTMRGSTGLNKQQAVVEALLAQDAEYHTEILAGSPAYGTTPVEAGYVAVCHPHLVKDIRAIPGFKPTAEYGQRVAFPGEIGAVEDVRYLTTSLLTPQASAGAATTGVKSTNGTNADVYPIIYIGADYFGSVVLRGKFAASLLAAPPKAQRGDELAQRGSIGWKGYMSTVILNDLWGAVLHTAASD